MNFKIFLILLAISLISILSLTAANASAQIPQGMPSMGGMTSISGKYINSQFGYEITLPAGWKGSEMSLDYMSTITTSPIPTSQQSENTGSSDVTMSILVGDKTKIDEAEKKGEAQFTPEAKAYAEKYKPTCDSPQESTTSIDGHDFQVSLVKCTYSPDNPVMYGTIKTKSYSAVINGISYTFIYSGDPDSFDKSVSLFDQSVQTLKLGNAGTVTTPHLEMKDNMEKINVKGNDVDLDLSSSSTISDFAVNEENKQISFKVSGDDGTQGITVIPVSKVLQGPYTITLDGQPITDFETLTDQTTGDVSIKIKYHHSTHNVIISGANVVPEFPTIATFILLASIMSVITFTAVFRKSSINSFGRL